MAKPTQWLVIVNGTPHKFTQRRPARQFAKNEKEKGKTVQTKPLFYFS